MDQRRGIPARALGASRVSGAELIFFYIDEVPTYRYELLCGSSFRSLTPSVPDPDTGEHFHWCQRCQETHSTLDEALIIERPRRPGKRNARSDVQQSMDYDMAIKKDRVAQHFRNSWDASTAEQIAALYGVSRSVVIEIGQRVGVYGVQNSD